MDKRKELYEALKTALESDTEIMHVDLWNRNVEFIEEDAAWARPAVFIEFGDIEWKPLKERTDRGLGTLTLHVVTDWDESDPTVAWDVTENVRDIVDQMSDANRIAMCLQTTKTNHDHEEIVESIDVYAVRY